MSVINFRLLAPLAHDFAALMSGLPPTEDNTINARRARTAAALYEVTTGAVQMHAADALALVAAIRDQADIADTLPRPEPVAPASLRMVPPWRRMAAARVVMPWAHRSGDYMRRQADELAAAIVAYEEAIARRKWGPWELDINNMELVLQTFSETRNPVYLCLHTYTSMSNIIADIFSLQPDLHEDELSYLVAAFQDIFDMKANLYTGGKGKQLDVAAYLEARYWDSTTGLEASRNPLTGGAA